MAYSFVISAGIKQGMKMGINDLCADVPDIRFFTHSRLTFMVFLHNLWITGMKNGTR